jgi:hypothetical protein
MYGICRIPFDSNFYAVQLFPILYAQFIPQVLISHVYSWSWVKLSYFIYDKCECDDMDVRDNSCFFAKYGKGIVLARVNSE